MGILNEFITSFTPQQSGYQFMWILSAMAVIAAGLALERWLWLDKFTNVDSSRFFNRILELIKEGKLHDASKLCDSGKARILPRIIGAGINKAITVPEMVTFAIEEESLHCIPLLEKRVNLLATIGNLATLCGLMGTIYGLILAFAAVAQPGVSPIEKSSMLASGISAAMNTTLLGLVIAVPCVLVYSVFKARIDETTMEIDRYAIALIKAVLPDQTIQKSLKISSLRIREEVDTEPNMVPFMNLMVVLIPLLLSTSEFVKLGMIELKLPESAARGGSGNETGKAAKIDLGVVITAKGFNLFHYFKKDTAGADTEIPLVDGKYDFATLNKKVAEVKRRALFEIVKQAKADIPSDIDLWKLSYLYSRNDFSTNKLFDDHENIKIVAEDKINYQTVVSVMDAARGITTASGSVTLFPNVAIAGGIVQ